MHYRTMATNLGNPDKGPITIEFRGPKAYFEWHCFVNHLIAGGDPEEFFTNLLK